MSSGGGFLGDIFRQVTSPLDFSRLDRVAQNVEDFISGASTSRGRRNKRRGSHPASEGTSSARVTSSRSEEEQPSRTFDRYFMGNGISCANSTGGKKRNSGGGGGGQQHPESSSAMHCDNCNAKFTRISLLSKRKCSQCQQFFCDGCFNGQGVCSRCEVLLRRPPVRTDLVGLRVKDLQRFLISKQISTKDCVEKKDLVELVFKENSGPVGHLDAAQGSASSTSSSAGCALEKQQQNFPKSYVNSTHRSEWFDRLDDVGQDAAAAASSLAEDASDDVEQAEEAMEVDDEQPPSLSQDQEEHLAPAVPKRFANQGLVYLADIGSLSDIEELSAKQAKDILAMNRVTFKGVVEKTDLLKIVERLWHQHQRLQEGKEEMDDQELCKVCMDNPVDCVMLECGHMCTCTNCGKQMAECPICRQYVVRVVKTFKA